MRACRARRSRDRGSVSSDAVGAAGAASPSAQAGFAAPPRAVETASAPLDGGAETRNVDRASVYRLRRGARLHAAPGGLDAVAARRLDARRLCALGRLDSRRGQTVPAAS